MGVEQNSCTTRAGLALQGWSWVSLIPARDWGCSGEGMKKRRKRRGRLKAVPEQGPRQQQEPGGGLRRKEIAAFVV